MFILKNLNVRRIVKTEKQRDVLIAKGFTLVEDDTNKKVSNTDVNDYSKMNIKELKKIAKERGLTRYSKLDKQELIELLKDNE